MTVSHIQLLNPDSMKLCFLTVGGTIDKVYFDKLSDYQVGEPGVLRILRDLPLTFEYRVESLLRKDSLDMTDDDRHLVRQAVIAAPEDRIVITHGTDTMIETAQRLLDIPDKRIVMTGAMQPEHFRNSDAVFNVGMAIGVVLSQPQPGIWITMSGQVFDPRTTRKNRSKGVFETVPA